jgi:hypothetical protein
MRSENRVMTCLLTYETRIVISHSILCGRIVRRARRDYPSQGPSLSPLSVVSSSDRISYYQQIVRQTLDMHDTPTWERHIIYWRELWTFWRSIMTLIKGLFVSFKAQRFCAESTCSVVIFTCFWCLLISQLAYVTLFQIKWHVKKLYQICWLAGR